MTMNDDMRAAFYIETPYDFRKDDDGTWCVRHDGAVIARFPTGDEAKLHYDRLAFECRWQAAVKAKQQHSPNTSIEDLNRETRAKEFDTGVRLENVCGIWRML